MRFNKLKNIVLILFAGVLLFSCKYKPLEFENIVTSRVKIQFDWSKVVENKATGMDLWLFPKNGGRPLLYSFTNIEGGEINVPYGEYKAVWMNSESTIVKYKKEEWDNFEIYTGLSTGVPDPFQNVHDLNPDNESVISPVDKYYSGMTENLIIGRPNREIQIINLEPVDRVCTYTVEVRGVKNLKYALGVSGGALSGISGAYMPTHNAIGTQPSFIVFPCSGDKENSRIMAEFKTFGANSENKKHELILFFRLGNGSRWFTKVDVSDQVNNAVDKCNVHIIIDHLMIPKPIVNGSGFHPTVDSWGDNEDIYIHV